MFDNYLRDISRAESDAESLIKSKKRFKLAADRMRTDSGRIYEESYANAQIQLFGNENNVMWPQILQMVPERPKVVGVAASADWLIDCIACGVQEVLCIDVNVHQVYMSVLKILAHAVLTYEEFNRFLVDPHSDECMSFETIERIFSGYDELPYKAVFEYWRKLFEAEDFDSKRVRSRFIAYEKMFMDLPWSKRKLRALYLNGPREYQYSQERLKAAWPNLKLFFENGSIFDRTILSKYTERYGKFDVLYTSNTLNFATPGTYLKEIYGTIQNYVNGVTVLYVIQLSIEEVVNGPMKPLWNMAAVQCYEQATTVVNVLGRIEDYQILMAEVETCRGFSNLLDGDADTVVIVKN